MTRDPHLPGAPYSPVRDLISKALRRYGDFAAGQADPEVALLLLDLANDVVDDVNAHPYRTGLDPIEPYQSLDDCREIPNQIVVAGLLAKYALQQTAMEKIQVHVPAYGPVLASLLFVARAGNSRLQVRPTDGGSNRATSPRANSFTGMPIE